MNIVYKNRWAFIIGGSMGIGFALAKEFLAKKSHVLIIARNENRLKSAVTDLKNSYPDGKVEYLVVDATQSEMIFEKFKMLNKEGITPYFLINCAGKASPNYFENISSQQLEETFRLNIMTAWNSIQAALPYLKKSGGYIINTSSVAGFLGVFGYADYSISKFGIIGLSEVLRSELEPQGIKIAVLCPPDTDTPGYHEENKTKPAETIAISSNSKLISAEIVARNTLKELEKGRFIILVNLESKLTWLLKKWMPNFLFRWIQKEVYKVQNRR
ncbi:MAG TPA: SDR family oxidoreductase [Chitinophagales bacterium]|nr:SDR family oxidoreductase [Chitinophagales bacterium]